jgi:hypothetical protein
MDGYNAIKIQLSILRGGKSSIRWKKMGRLCETIHHDSNEIISFGCAGQTHNKIHENILLFPNQNRQML